MKPKYAAVLARVRSDVGRYQPVIEERTGVALGKVAVDDLAEWNAENYDKERKRLREDYLAATGLDKIRAWFAYTYCRANAAGALMKTEGSCIYVDTDSGDRIQDSDVVHELCHVMWNVIEGQRPEFDWKLSSKEMLWHEGFATYGEEVLFADIHGVTPHKKPKYYQDGKRAVEDAVAKYGPQIFLRIPKEWTSIDAKITDSIF